MRKTRAFLLIWLGLVVAAASADAAPGDAWAVAKGVLPPTPKLVVGVHVGALSRSRLYQQVEPIVAGALKQEHDACAAISAASLEDVVVATDDHKNGVVFLTMTGVDRAKIDKCFAKYEDRSKTPVSPGKKSKIGTYVSPIGEYHIGGFSFAVMYFAKNVFAVATTPSDATLLRKWTSNKGIDPTSQIGMAVSRINTSAAIWGARDLGAEVTPDYALRSGYGTIDVVKGMFNVDLHLVTASSKDATNLVNRANLKLQPQNTGNLPPFLAALLQSVRIRSLGTDVEATASVSETTAIMVLAMAMAAH
jgi:hypothetical protein